MPNKVYDVLIIGAGLSGFVAAQHLTSLGYHVCMLEARNRLGGRVHSRILKDHTVELGAAYLRGKGSGTAPNPLLGLLKRYQIQTTPLDPLNSDFYNRAGEKSSLAEWQSTLKEPIERANKLIQDAKLPSKTPKPSLASILGYAAEIPPQGSKEFKVRQLITATVLQNTGAAPNQVSLLELMYDGTFTGSDELIVSGAHKLIDGLHQECQATQNFNLFLKSNVQEIQHAPQDSKFKVKTETGEEYQTEAVLCTVPLGVLKRNHIKFLPGLSKAKQKAIRHLNLGEQNYVVLEFNKAFWPESVHYLYPNDSDINQWPSYLNLVPFTNGRPMLLANLYGNDAKFSKQKESDIIDKVLMPLKRVYKDKVTDPIAVDISHWDSERFTAGAIPYCGLLSTDEDLLALQAPEQNGLYFAGDYTHRGQRHSLNAAYSSGIKAALEMHAQLITKVNLKERLANNRDKPGKPSRNS